MPRSPCPSGMTRDVKTKKCRDKKKPGRKPKSAPKSEPKVVPKSAPKSAPKVESKSVPKVSSKSAPKVSSKYTEEYLQGLEYPKLVEIHKKMEESGKIMMRKGMKRDAAHLVERILRKQ